MKQQKQKRQKFERRRIRTRTKIKKDSKYPRLSVFRSNQHIYAQLIDDRQSKTLISLSDLDIKKKLTKIEKAEEIGQEIAKKALAKKIEKVVFDRGGYKYHGRIKALAERARQGGLVF